MPPNVQECAATDSPVWRTSVPLVAGDVVLVATLGTQVVVVAKVSTP